MLRLEQLQRACRGVHLGVGAMQGPSADGVHEGMLDAVSLMQPLQSLQPSLEHLRHSCGVLPYKGLWHKPVPLVIHGLPASRCIVS